MWILKETLGNWSKVNFQIFSKILEGDISTKVAHIFFWIKFNILTTIVSSKIELHISGSSMQYEDEFCANKSKFLAHVKIWNLANKVIFPKNMNILIFKSSFLTESSVGVGGGEGGSVRVIPPLPPMFLKQLQNSFHWFLDAKSLLVTNNFKHVEISEHYLSSILSFRSKTETCPEKIPFFWLNS